jgi:quinol monooxygenase YgiN
MRETNGEKARTRERNLRWMEALWEGTSTSAKEEDHKEEVLEVFRDLVSESRSEREVREYVPWQPLW